MKWGKTHLMPIFEIKAIRNVVLNKPMNFSLRVIQDLGGYEKVKNILTNPFSFFFHNTKELKKHLNEYKKYEPHDKVILDIVEEKNIYEIDYEFKRSCGFMMKCGKAVSYSLVLRHAEKAEIQIGYQLDE